MIGCIEDTFVSWRYKLFPDGHEEGPPTTIPQLQWNIGTIVGHFLPGVLNRRISLWSPSPRYHRSRAKGGRTLALGPPHRQWSQHEHPGKWGLNTDIGRYCSLGIRLYCKISYFFTVTKSCVWFTILEPKPMDFLVWGVHRVASWAQKWGKMAFFSVSWTE